VTTRLTTKASAQQIIQNAQAVAPPPVNKEEKLEVKVEVCVQKICKLFLFFMLNSIVSTYNTIQSNAIKYLFNSHVDMQQLMKGFS